VPFESLGAVSYSPSIVTMVVGLSVAVCEIFSVKEWCDLDNRGPPQHHVEFQEGNGRARCGFKAEGLLGHMTRRASRFQTPDSQLSFVHTGLQIWETHVGGQYLVQELNCRKQIARQLRIQYVKGMVPFES